MLQAGAIEQTINPELYYLGGSTPFLSNKSKQDKQSNMSNVLQDLIYPALYENIAEALPDFRFKKMPGDKGYKAMSGVKIDGSTGEAERFLFMLIT